MLTPSNNIYRSFLFYGSSAVISFLMLIAILYLQHFHISIPAIYDHDGLAVGTMVKTLIEHGSFLHNPQLGAPYGYDLSDYPLSESATFFILKLLSLGSSNFAIVINLFLLLSFPLTTLSALFAFQYLGLNKPFALCASLLFAFLPYQFLRMEMGHLFLLSIFVIPIYVFLIFSVFKEPLFFGPAHSPTSSPHLKKYLLLVACIVTCFFIASSGVYYAFFAAYLLLLAGTKASLEKKQWYPLGNAGIIVLFLSLTVLLNISPAIITKIQQGSNRDVAHRAPFESEHYGLKISQLLLPVDQHRLKRLASAKEHYAISAPLVTENKTATLGIIGSIGFLLLLSALFIRKSPFSSDTFSDLSKLNIAALLFATIGGISSLFAYLVTPMIRCPNRMSVFIAFFSLAAFFIFLQEILKNRFPHLNKSYWLIAILCLVIGIIDQVPRRHFSHHVAQFQSDAQFVQDIEKIMPAGTMVMQLPFTEFPESVAIQQLDSYSLFRGYLHSHTLHWSFGTMRGRGVALWQNTVTNKPIRDMLDDLVYAGFRGLYVNKNGYADHGQAIEKQIADLLHAGPTLTNDELVFYDLRPYANTLHLSMSSTAWKLQVDRVYAAMNKANI